MFHVGLPCYLRLSSGRSVSINVNKTRKYFSRNIHGARMFPQCFPVSHVGKHCFQCQFLFSRCKLCLRYIHGRKFTRKSEHGALTKILRVRAASSHLIFASNSSKGQILRALKLDGTIRYPYQYVGLLIATYWLDDLKRNIAIHVLLINAALKAILVSCWCCNNSACKVAKD